MVKYNETTKTMKIDVNKGKLVIDVLGTSRQPKVVISFIPKAGEDEILLASVSNEGNFKDAKTPFITVRAYDEENPERITVQI